MTYVESAPIKMHFPLWVRLVSALLITAPIAAAWLVWGQDTPAEEWHAVLPYAVLGLWLALTYQVFLVELYYDERGLTYVSPIAGVVRIAWRDVIGVTYVRGLDGYVIETDDGLRIWSQHGRIGMADIADALLSRLPRHARGGR